MAKKTETKAAEQQQPTYEELTAEYNKLYNYAKQLEEQVQTSNLNNLFRKLELLTKILDHDRMFSKEFIDKCIAEIENMLDPKKEEKTEEE